MSNDYSKERLEGSAEALSVFAMETVNTKDVPPGGKDSYPDFSLLDKGPEIIPKLAEELTPQEQTRRQNMIDEYTRLLGLYVKPHSIKSKWVKDSDLKKVLEDGTDMVVMCSIPRGKYRGGAALAHPQIEEKHPLRFFVLPTGMVVINPVIVNHTKSPIFKEEGCLSWPEHAVLTMVQRYNKVTATYQTLNKEGDKPAFLSEPRTEELNGNAAHIFQHECGHLNGGCIYDEDYNPAKSIGFGDGLTVDTKIWISRKVEGSKDEVKTKKSIWNKIIS